MHSRYSWPDYPSGTSTTLLVRSSQIDARWITPVRTSLARCVDSQRRAWMLYFFALARRGLVDRSSPMENGRSTRPTSNWPAAYASSHSSSSRSSRYRCSRAGLQPNLALCSLPNLRSMASYGAPASHIPASCSHACRWAHGRSWPNTSSPSIPPSPGGSAAPSASSCASSTSKTLAGGTSGKTHPQASQLACLAGHVRVTGSGAGAADSGDHLRNLIGGDSAGVCGRLRTQAHPSFTL